MLSFRDVTVAYQHQTILEHINVDFPKGKITAFIGPNGCGKTTLLQSLIGGSRVVSGTITLDGEDFLSRTPKERARSLAFLPQVRTIIPTLPVKTLVEHGRFPHLGFARRKTAEDIRLVQDAMRITGTLPYATQSVDTLSGGTRQRVFLAMILAQNCDTIVMDEPTTYLDLIGQKEFLSIVSKLRETGKTIILVLHDLAQAIRIADHVVVMQNKKIVATGTPKQCLQQHVIQDVFGTECVTFERDGKEYYFFE